MSKYENLTGTQLEGFPDEDPKQSLNNTVIEVLTREHGAKVIEWWKIQGIDTGDCEGNCCKEYGYGCRYYGVIKGKFGNYSSKAVDTHNAKIITLPEEKTLDNTVIESLTREHGAKVIEWWKKQGINTYDYEGNCCNEDASGFRYYGVINGNFGNYSLKEVNTHNAKIITLPKEKSLPRWMWCWDYFEEKAVKRLVIYYNEQLLHKYITLSETEAKRYLDGMLNCTFISYLYAKEIEEPENKMDAAIEEICKELDGIVNQLKSLNK